jgi:hypothetical protein
LLREAAASHTPHGDVYLEIYLTQHDPAGEVWLYRNGASRQILKSQEQGGA